MHCRLDGCAANTIPMADFEWRIIAEHQIDPNGSSEPSLDAR